MEDQEMVQLRKFCGGLYAQLDQNTGEGAPLAASELVKRGFEDGFTLYDTPPDLPFKHFPKKMTKGHTIASGMMTLKEAEDKCLQNKKCKGITTGPMFKATKYKKGMVELKDAWKDPGKNSGYGDSYKNEGFLVQPPWLDTQKFESPMRRLYQEGPSLALPAAQALLLLPQPGSLITSSARTQRAQRDFL